MIFNVAKNSDYHFYFQACEYWDHDDLHLFGCTVLSPQFSLRFALLGGTVLSPRYSLRLALHPGSAKGIFHFSCSRDDVFSYNFMAFCPRCTSWTQSLDPLFFMVPRSGDLDCCRWLGYDYKRDQTLLLQRMICCKWTILRGFIQTEFGTILSASRLSSVFSPFSTGFERQETESQAGRGTPYLILLSQRQLPL